MDPHNRWSGRRYGAPAGSGGTAFRARSRAWSGHHWPAAGVTMPYAGSAGPEVPRVHWPLENPGLLSHSDASASGLPVSAVGRAPAPLPGGLHHSSGAGNRPAGGCHSPQSATAWLDFDGTVVVQSATQGAFATRQGLAELLDLPLDRVRVRPTPLGGAFGGKLMLPEPLAAAAALAAEAPGAGRVHAHGGLRRGEPGAGRAARRRGRRVARRAGSRRSARASSATAG